MSQYAIRAEGLGKRFRISSLHGGRGIHEAVERLVRRYTNHSAQDSWALRDVSFEVRHGEVLGILGRNGAGKSVLLKILARVTAPTLGSAELFGRVAPLLEVGAGFHPDLSGRDNVYFNGAILGMERGQIQRKFDEIVGFAGVAPMIDNPVKLYSTGMRMRLAFSIAAHLEPDILLIDEALSVGDAEFRARSREKIREFIRHGCTLLLVSHDASILADLCRRAILLTDGKLSASGEIAEILGLHAAQSSLKAVRDPVGGAA